MRSGREFHRGLAGKEGERSEAEEREKRNEREGERKAREGWRSEGPLLFFLD